MRVASLALFAAAIAAAPSPAAAYGEPTRFDDGIVAGDATGSHGGGAGRHFTGSPMDGHTCDVCHGEDEVPLPFRGLPELGYRPGEAYLLSMDLGAGPGAVGGSLEVTDAAGAALGTLEALADEELTDEERCSSGGAPTEGATAIYAVGDARQVASTRACGARLTRALWTAPAEGSGPAFVYGVSVRGDSSGTTEGDRVGHFALSVPVEGAPPPEIVLDGGCAAAGPPGRPPSSLAGLLLVALISLGRTRRRPRGRESMRVARRVSALVSALAWAVPAAQLLVPTGAAAVPGPATTAILANASTPESVALAERYAEARGVPRGQLCALPIDEVVDLDLATYRAQVQGPLEACLDAAGALDRIEAVVIMRGVPLRVGVPDGAATRRVSLAAALGTWRSTVDGSPLLGEPPGFTADCGGTACYAPRVSNPFRTGIFEGGWERTTGGITFRPLLVTMLHGRSYAEAGGLLDSALAAEGAGGSGEFLFMNGRDPARGVLDAEYDRVMTELRDRGFDDTARVPFETNLEGRSLAAFFTGTATLGTTIEGNTFLPGALVDNLTSFGAVPENFEATGERQVSIARWVAQGVAGAHGTTDEPLNGCFPSRFLIVQYVDGATLAEAYHRNLPNVYWHNLVLGDPMAAPYAVRPVVTARGAADGETIDDARAVTFDATDPEGLGVDSLRIYRDGALLVESAGEAIDLCLDVAPGVETTLLAVAQKRDDESPRGLHRPKGWVTLTLTGAAGRSSCEEPDAGVGADGSVDSSTGDDAGTMADTGAPGAMGSSGCGCTVGARARPGATTWAAMVTGLLVLWGVRRRRRGQGQGR